SAIARRTGTKVSTIMAINGIKDPTKLRIGQTLKLSAATKPVATKPAPTASKGTHTVMPGETLYAIARKNGLSVSKLTKLNPGINPNKLAPGQSLILSGNAKTTPKETEKPAEKKPVKTLAEAKPSPLPPAVEEATAPAPAPEEAAEKEQTLPENTQSDLVLRKERGDILEDIFNEAPVKAPRRIASVMVDKEISFSDLATAHQSSPSQLNALNGWKLKPTTILARGSEIYVPGH
ncbi:MAG: LysM peptidoglycan-binding domain-containing protein, partial [Verrucomicrobiota bacterium]